MSTRRTYTVEVRVPKFPFSWEAVERVFDWLVERMPGVMTSISVTDTDGEIRTLSGSVADVRRQIEAAGSHVVDFFATVAGERSSDDELFNRAVSGTISHHTAWDRHEGVGGMSVKISGTDQLRVHGLASALQQAIDRGLVAVEAVRVGPESQPESQPQASRSWRFLMNPWTIGIGAVVIGGIILALILGQ